MSVNLSPPARRGRLPNDVARVLHDTGAVLESAWLEITEHVDA
jgi:hypothetical protein